MCGNRNTTGSAVLWPCLVRLFLFMTTSQLIRRPASVSHTIEQAQQALTLLNTTLETVLPRPRRAQEEGAGDPDEES